jgi:hypothetical protein
VDDINKDLQKIAREIDEVEKYFEHAAKKEYSSEDVINHYKSTRQQKTKKADVKPDPTADTHLLKEKFFIV